MMINIWSSLKQTKGFGKEDIRIEQNKSLIEKNTNKVIKDIYKTQIFDLLCWKIKYYNDGQYQYVLGEKGLTSELAAMNRWKV